MKIITGKTGTNHVNSDDDRALHMGIFGTETYVLSIGECLKATMIDANTCRIAAGELVMYGCHARIEPGNYDDLQIDSGSPGYNRKDLVVARYRKDTGIENVTLEVIKGVVSIGEAERPSYTSGHLYWGADVCDMPLYEISLNGINIASVTPLFNKLYQNLSNIYTREEVYNKKEVYNKGEVYNREETYKKGEVYNKTETYNKNDANNAISESEKRCNNSAVNYTDSAIKKYNTDVVDKHIEGIDTIMNEIAGKVTSLAALDKKNFKKIRSDSNAQKLSELDVSLEKFSATDLAGAIKFYNQFLEKLLGVIKSYGEIDLTSYDSIS